MRRSKRKAGRVLTGLLVIALMIPSFAAIGPTMAVAETIGPMTSWAPVSISSDTSMAVPPMSMTPSMTAELAAARTMDTLMDPVAMKLHMDLMSPEMKAMMAEMMGSTEPTTTAVGGEHDHSGGGHTPASTVVHRFGDASVADRAVQLSRSVYETGTVRNAVLVNAAQYHESLAAAGLAGTVGGPLLPTSASSTPESVLAELRRLGVRRVYIVGSTSHVSTSVRNKLVSRGLAVSRIAGTDRNSTAAAVARKIASLRKVTTLGAVLIVNSDRPWDAATVSPYSYARKIPVLFVNGIGVPSATARVLADLRVRKAIVVGSGISIKDSTYRSIARRTPLTDTRIVADTRWALANAVARYAIARGWSTAEHPVVSNGTDALADALIAGPHAGSKGSVLLLTPSTSLPRVARVFVNEFRPSIGHAVVVGTTETVSDAVLRDIQSLLQGSMGH